MHTQHHQRRKKPKTFFPCPMHRRCPPCLLQMSSMSSSSEDRFGRSLADRRTPNGQNISSTDSRRRQKALQFIRIPTHTAHEMEELESHDNHVTELEIKSHLKASKKVTKTHNRKKKLFPIEINRLLASKVSVLSILSLSN